MSAHRITLTLDVTTDDEELLSGNRATPVDVNNAISEHLLGLDFVVPVNGIDIEAQVAWAGEPWSRGKAHIHLASEQ